MSSAAAPLTAAVALEHGDDGGDEAWWLARWGPLSRWPGESLKQRAFGPKRGGKASKSSRKQPPKMDAFPQLLEYM
jgi:hypothetical protein